MPHAQTSKQVPERSGQRCKLGVVGLTLAAIARHFSDWAASVKESRFVHYSVATLATIGGGLIGYNFPIIFMTLVLVDDEWQLNDFESGTARRSFRPTLRPDAHGCPVRDQRLRLGAGTFAGVVARRPYRRRAGWQLKKVFFAKHWRTWLREDGQAGLINSNTSSPDAGDLPREHAGTPVNGLHFGRAWAAIRLRPPTARS